MHAAAFSAAPNAPSLLAAESVHTRRHAPDAPSLLAQKLMHPTRLPCWQQSLCTRGGTQHAPDAGSRVYAHAAARTRRAFPAGTEIDTLDAPSLLAAESVHTRRHAARTRRWQQSLCTRSTHAPDAAPLLDTRFARPCCCPWLPLVLLTCACPELNARARPVRMDTQTGVRGVVSRVRV